jgi:DNA polymerase-1
MTRTLLIDTSSVVFRAHHALPPMTTRAGVPTAALYGTSALLLKLLREERPGALAFALDAPKATFRHERMDTYKGTRKPLPDSLRQELARLPDLLAAFGAPTHRAPGFEADDVLATLARRLGERGDVVRIVTGDRDLFQLTRDAVDVLFIGRRGERPIVYDADAVERRFGVAPDRLPFLIALVGDKSDNLPGVPGIGPRSGAKLVATAADATELIARAAEIPSAALRNAVTGAAEQIRLTEDLARLRTDVELADGLLVAPVTRDAVPRLRRFFEELEFKSLMPRLDALEPLLPEAIAG